MPLSPRGCLVVGGTIVLVACSSTKSSPSSAGTNASSACPSYVAAERAKEKRCNRYSARPTSPDEEAKAVARLSTLCTGAASAPGNGITTEQLLACADAMGSSCEASDACDALRTTPGTLPDGTACGLGSQCAGGVCVSPVKDGSSFACGTCAQRTAIGGRCDDNIPCVPGAACISGTCTTLPKLPLGAVCYDPANPSVGGACATGLSCEIGDTTTLTKCTQPGGIGTACTSKTECRGELECIFRACAVPLEMGSTCERDIDCVSSACSDTTKKCVAVTFGPAGASCNGSDLRCARGSCARANPSTNDGHCVAPLPEGAACSAGSDGTGAFCDAYASCVARTCQLFDPATCK